MKILLAIPLLLLAGCPSLGMQEMTPEQIKAMDGLVTCSQISSVYGKGSNITANPDRLPKGASGETTVTCGDSSMTIKAASPK